MSSAPPDPPAEQPGLAAHKRSARVAALADWIDRLGDEGRLRARPWVEQAIVLGHAAAAGLLVVAMTLLAEAAYAGFVAVEHAGRWGRYAPLLWSPAVTVAVVWWTRRFAPATAGSGIPQVMRALDDTLDESQRHWLVSLRLSLHKVMLVSGSLLAGLSAGREGPAVQVCAGVMDHAKRWLSPRSAIDSHDLMVAGAAAGIAAAFNTPLGGIVFAFEKLSRRRSPTHSALVIAAIVLCGLVSVAVFGNETYFGRLSVQQLSVSMLLPGMLIALATGLAGGLFSRLVLVAVDSAPGRLEQMRRRRPLRFAAVCGLAVAVMGVATGGATAGAGYGATRALLEGHAELPGVYTLLKFCATWITTWSGVPAGIFAPSLAIGAGIGHDVAWAWGLHQEAAIPLIALGMVGFLSAATQGPITAFIIVMEMVAGQSMVLSLMACSLLAGGVGRLIAPPLYATLAARLSLPPQAPRN